MKVIIAKLGATGDVVRTTPLLNRLNADVTWITAAKNLCFVDGIFPALRALSWEDRDKARGERYDLAINLEDTDDVGEFMAGVKADQRFGAVLVNGSKKLDYTENARAWFDLSLISRFGKEKADELKFLNRRTYQDMVFEGLGFKFDADSYVMPKPTDTGLRGDVAIAKEAGPVWPMKNWAYYGELQARLESLGFKVNVLQKRPTLMEHLSDVKNHRCVVGGDSLPMHLALGCGVRCVSIFNCTSPWEIHDYGLLKKIVSPLLGEFFYKRSFDPRATTAVPLEDVLDAVTAQLANTR